MILEISCDYHCKYINCHNNYQFKNSMLVIVFSNDSLHIAVATLITSVNSFIVTTVIRLTWKLLNHFFSSNEDGITPVHQAASEGHVDCLKMLLAANAQFDVKDCRGNTPLNLAKLWGHRQCARYVGNWCLSCSD